MFQIRYFWGHCRVEVRDGIVLLLPGILPTCLLAGPATVTIISIVDVVHDAKQFPYRRLYCV